MKLELSINKESPNFDTVRAEVMAQEIDGEKEGTKKTTSYFDTDIVDKVFLESTVATKEANKYAIATFNGKEIHLTSLKGSNNQLCNVVTYVVIIVILFCINLVTEFQK